MSAVASNIIGARSPSRGLWSRALVAVLLAQFLSATADNALLFGALALLRNEHYPSWTAPLLQEFFVGAFILLAPFVGPFADSRSKGTVMLIANGVKLIGSLGMCIGLNPFLMYGMVGAGAAAYSPAKYGILSELTSADHLVKANSLIESSTIAAILIGAVAGGTLADWSVPAALGIVTGCYAAAAMANLLIPRLPPARSLERLSIPVILRSFGDAITSLLKIPDARFSIFGTSLFWGAGSTMRFLLVAWVPLALGVTNNRMPARPGATFPACWHPPWSRGLLPCVDDKLTDRLRAHGRGRRLRRLLCCSPERPVTGQGSSKRRGRKRDRYPESVGECLYAADGRFVYPHRPRRRGCEYERDRIWPLPRFLHYCVMDLSRESGCSKSGNSTGRKNHAKCLRRQTYL
jgi:hypothetical protein